jgi:glycosyltransferase involved in cell wall biosynthesis
MNSLPQVSIVIPAFNEELYIRQTLKALIKSDYPRSLLEIIVVDNASSDNTVSIASEYADKVLILKEGNVGAVRNLGAVKSKGELLIFLDSDCLVDSSWISRGVKLVRNNPNHIYGGPCKVRENAKWAERLWLLENPKHPRLQPDLLGSCIFISRRNFEGIRGFNEKMTSGEDSDLSYRLRKNEKLVKIEENLSVVHLGNPQSLSGFFIRQIWHSENYLSFIKRSIRDYMFWMVVLFITGISVSISGLLFFKIYIFVGGIILSSVISGTLTAKRLFITKYFPKSPLELLGISFLDFIYLLARSIGIIKSLKNLFKKTIVA